jgi:Family of unknown function (DUF6241)
VVELNNYGNGEIYLEMLHRWEKGDFSQSVSEHNRLWEILGGTIGKATRLMTDEEQKAYAE